MENKRQHLQSIAILLLSIAQISSQIKMNSYVRDMNSLWESQIELNQRLSDFDSSVLQFQSICLSFQEEVLDYLGIVECSQKQ